MSSLVCENYFNLKMSCENLLRILFTPYPIHSDLGVILPLFDLAVLLLVCKILIFRFTGLASTFSLLVSSARPPVQKPPGERGLAIEAAASNTNNYRDKLQLPFKRDKVRERIRNQLYYSPNKTRPKTTPSYPRPTRKKSGHSHG